jgi:superfamily II DNA/RNA helicase
MRSDIQEVFIKTKHNKQVMMFSATMPDEIKKGKLNLTQIVKNS